MSKPTARELLDRMAEDLMAGMGGIEDELVARVERVLALHTPRAESGPRCSECHKGTDYQGQGWPCATVRLLNGAER